MAEPLSPSHQPGAASRRNEWSALLECASPSRNRQRLAGFLRSVDWARLLTLAEEHGVAGHLTASLRGLEEDLIPPEIRQALVDRRDAQNFYFEADGGAVSHIGPVHLGGNRRPCRKRASARGASLR